MSGKSILLVEDDDTLVHSISRNLSVRGYTTRAASTVQAALKELDAAIPDIVVLDIDLPDGSGWDVLRSLRARSGEDVPVIVISALRPNPRLVTELDCSNVLEKPFPMESLLRLIAENLERAGGPTSSRNRRNKNA
jgi:DNA-binding response OmpR family regulator